MNLIGVTCSRVTPQIPVILAYVIAIHKSQGSTLDTVIMSLNSGIFANGTAYGGIVQTVHNTWATPTGFIILLAMIPVLRTGCPPYAFFSLTSCTDEKCIFQLS